MRSIFTAQRLRSNAWPFEYHQYDENGVLRNYSCNGGIMPETGEETTLFTEEVLLKFAEDFADAAEAAFNCGFDVLLIHGGHGLILSQFLSPKFNTRTDEFGGSSENRMRFPLMVLQAVRRRVGDSILIEYRISGSELGGEGTFNIGDCIDFLKKAQEYIDIAHVSAGSTFTETEHVTHPTNFLQPGCNTYLAAAVKACPDIRIPVLTLGGYQEPELMEEVIASGKADIVAMARGTISDPDCPNKARSGLADEIIPCIKCFHCLDYARQTAFACSVNPEVGREAILPWLIPPVGEKQKVVVIGGGPSSMQAAITARKRGHDVILIERETYLGGKLVFSEQVPFKRDLFRFMNYQINMLKKLGVEVRLGTNATPGTVETLKPDVVIAAVGSDAIVPPIPGIGGPNVITAEECYEKIKAGEDLGRKIAVLGGGGVGCETALYLAMNHNKDVELVEMTDALAREEFWLPQYAITEQMDRYVAYHLNARCTGITPDGMLYVDESGKERSIIADTIVLAAGLKPRREAAKAFRPAAGLFIACGDCVNAKNVRTATRTAYDAAVQL